MIREQNLARRRPFLILASLCLLLTLGAWWFYFARATTLTQNELESVNGDSANLQRLATQFDALDAETKGLLDEAAPLIVAVDERAAWAKIIDELGTKLPNRFIWVTSLEPLSDGKPVGGGMPGTTTTRVAVPAPHPSAAGHGGGNREGRGGRGGRGGGGGFGGGGGGPVIDALQIGGLYLTDPPNTKEARIVDEFVEQLRKSPAFDLEGKSNQDVIVERTTPDGRSWAYAYTIILPLRHPIALP